MYCNPDFTQVEDKCYKLLPQQYNYTDGRDQCKELNATLPVRPSLNQEVSKNHSKIYMINHK